MRWTKTGCLKTIGKAFFDKYSVDELAELSDFEIGKSGRLAEPMYLPESASHYQPISWDEAFKKVGAHLNALNSPDEAVFYTSGRTTNEAAFLYQGTVGVNYMLTSDIDVGARYRYAATAGGEWTGAGAGAQSQDLDYENHIFAATLNYRF